MGNYALIPKPLTQVSLSEPRLGLDVRQSYHLLWLVQKLRPAFRLMRTPHAHGACTEMRWSRPHRSLALGPGLRLLREGFEVRLRLSFEFAGSRECIDLISSEVRKIKKETSLVRSPHIAEATMQGVLFIVASLVAFATGQDCPAYYVRSQSGQSCYRYVSYILFYFHFYYWVCRFSHSCLTNLYVNIKWYARLKYMEYLTKGTSHPVYRTGHWRFR